MWDSSTPGAGPGEGGSGEGLCCLWKATSTAGTERRAEGADPQQVTLNFLLVFNKAMVEMLRRSFWKHLHQGVALSKLLQFGDHNPLLRPGCAKAEGAKAP